MDLPPCARVSALVTCDSRWASRAPRAPRHASAPSASPRHSSSPHHSSNPRPAARAAGSRRGPSGQGNNVGCREAKRVVGGGTWPEPLYPHHSSPRDIRSYSLAPTVLIEDPGHGTRVASRPPKLFPCPDGSHREHATLAA